jgi:hypothetical protein
MAALTGSETLATLNGLFKEVYGDDIKQLVPAPMKVQQMIPFKGGAKRLGNKYHQPVVLAFPGGFTHAATNSGAFALNAAIASTMKDAQLDPSQIVLQEYMDYEAAARSAQGVNAFVDGTKLIFELMQKSARKRIEAELLYGQVGLGKISTSSSATSPTVVTFTAATWASGLWNGTENNTFDVYNGSSQVNTNAALVVSAVDVDARQVTFTGNNTDIAALAAGYDFYFRGAYGQEMAGISKVLSNTSSLFGIDAAVYNLWKATQYSAGSAALTYNKVKAAVAQAVGKGLDDDVVLLVNPKGWDSIMTDLAALRRFVEKQGKGMAYEIGAENIVFYAQAGKVEVISHMMVKEGEAYGLIKDSWKRVGAADLTFQTPGYGGQIFSQLESYAGFLVRSYSNQAILCEQPARNFLINNIVNP